MSKAYRHIGQILDNAEMQLVTGHGGRACLVTYSLLRGVTSTAVMAQTGHANVLSMQPYTRLSAENEKTLQDCLAGKFRRSSNKKASMTKKKNTGGRASNRIRSAETSPRMSPVGGYSRDAKKARMSRSDPVSSDSASGSSGEDASLQDDDVKAAYKGQVKDTLSGVAKKKFEYLEDFTRSLKKELDEQKRERSMVLEKLDRVLAMQTGSLTVVQQVYWRRV